MRSWRRSTRACRGCGRSTPLLRMLLTMRATQLNSRAMPSQRRSAHALSPRRLWSELPSGLPKRRSGSASERRARHGLPLPA